MKKLVLLFAAVFAMTFVSCETKSASDASGSSASTESVSPAAEGETTEVKDNAAAPTEQNTNAGEQTTENNTETKTEG
ncbi:MAG: hypothetical protein IKW83_01530 [Muribaculaceae bacterium]|nr:hypothetical protein [Muribaculaceae bacterium]